MSTSEFENVSLSVHEGVAHLEMQRPQALNALDRGLTADLQAALGTIAQDQTVRAVILSGAGRAFCAGADLRDVTSTDLTPQGHPDLERALQERYSPLVSAVRELPKPVIAAVRGAAAGIGASLALACDLVLIARAGYLLLAFVNIGLAPDGGCLSWIASRAGLARATEMAMLGERIGAERALAWGLVNRVVEDEGLLAEAGLLADRLAGGPTLAYGAIKRQLNNWLYSGLPEQLALEARIQGEMAASDDFAAGVGAFLEGRAAEFRGR